VGRLEQLNLNAQAQSVCSRRGISDVINSGLGLVITPSGYGSEVVVGVVCRLTTTSTLATMAWRRVSVFMSR